MVRKGSRYARIEIDGAVSPTRKDFIFSITRTISEVFGEVGLVDIDLRLVRYDEGRRDAVVRCNRDELKKLRAAIALVSQIQGQPVMLHVTRVSGSFKGLVKQ